MTVSQLGARAGTSSDTVRYYERIGLLPAAERTASGYRVYGEEALEQVRFIKRAQRLGLQLGEIAQLMDIRRQGLCPCGSTKRLLEARLAALDEEMQTLARLREDIHRMVVELPTRSEDGPSCVSGLLEIGRAAPAVAASRVSPAPAAVAPTNGTSTQRNGSRTAASRSRTTGARRRMEEST